MILMLCHVILSYKNLVNMRTKRETFLACHGDSPIFHQFFYLFFTILELCNVLLGYNYCKRHNCTVSSQSYTILQFSWPWKMI